MNLRRLPAAAGLAVWLAAAPLLLNASLAQAVGLPSTNVAWVPAAIDADIDAAFAKAKAERKPVLLYWGATWCPPCNQLKTTLFNRQDFAAQAKGFVAVHIDGDRPGAQKLGSRFKVVGYPTVILMSPEGTEITRLPGEVDAQQVMAVLQASMAGGRPIKSVLADARAAKPVSAAEWRMLAFYAWDLDENQLAPAAQRSALLTDLAAKAPSTDDEVATRLWLKALTAGADDKPAAKATDQAVVANAGQRERLQKLLADPVRSRAQMDMLVNYAADLSNAVAPEGSAERPAVASAFDAALARLQADASLSRADRVGALIARVDLARAGQAKNALQPKLPAPLVQEVRDMAARMDREITDGYERQAVITSVAYMQGNAGLWADSDALLKANLAKSHSPYYLMSQLGSNAKKQGRTTEALDWYAQAFDKSEGPATRLQWGSSYLTALVELAPKDSARIEQVAAQLLKEAANDKSAFYERSARSLQRAGDKLVAWNAGGAHAASLKRLQSQLDGVCGKVSTDDGQRAACQGLLKGGASRDKSA